MEKMKTWRDISWAASVAVPMVLTIVVPYRITPIVLMLRRDTASPACIADMHRCMSVSYILLCTKEISAPIFPASGALSCTQHGAEGREIYPEQGSDIANGGDAEHVGKIEDALAVQQEEHGPHAHIL